MITYISEDYNEIDPEEELKKLVGDNYIGCTIRNGKLVEFRTKDKLPAASVAAIISKFGKTFSEAP